jgi:hypothetical protein
VQRSRPATPKWIAAAAVDDDASSAQAALRLRTCGLQERVDMRSPALRGRVSHILFSSGSMPGQGG